MYHMQKSSLSYPTKLHLLGMKKSFQIYFYFFKPLKTQALILICFSSLIVMIFLHTVFKGEFYKFCNKKGL